MKKKTSLKDTLCYRPKAAADVLTEKSRAEMEAFCKDYRAFLDTGKTEREVVSFAEAKAVRAGFRPYTFGCAVKAGDRFYYNNRGKSLHVFVIGQEPLSCGVRLSAAHIDSPRIDLKPTPLYEDAGMALFKTHYYGGLRKYQWTALPLSLHGVVVKADGTACTVRIGDDPGDPVFYISDLLPHLGKDQSAKPLSEAITGEGLNVLVGTDPCPDEEGEGLIKLNVLRLLNEQYGMTETDFITAELCLTPAFGARDIGLDRSLIGSYGHDDRVCAYPMFRAVLEEKKPLHTVYAILADKEEIGSYGNTGMQCDILTDILSDLAAQTGTNPGLMRANSVCLSADVNAAFDPNFPEVYDKRNASYVNRGVVVTKYTGARGKSSTSDAGAEYFGFVRRAFDADAVLWQTGELGKVDQGGGGTVAMYIAQHNIDTIDIGVAVISMHAPYEVVSKFDVFETYRAVRAFNRFNA